MITEFTISRKEWLRGEGSEKSFLLADDGRRCCVGIYANKCGIPDKQLLNFSYVDNHLVIGAPELKWLWGDEYETAEARELYETNDEMFTPESEREQKITELFAQQGIKVTFED